MTCRHARIYFDDYVSGRLAANDKARLEEHLNDCIQCRDELEKEKNLLHFLKSDRVPDPGEYYWSNLESSILKKTIEKSNSVTAQRAHPHPQTARSITRYLIPIAASILLLITSISDLGLKTSPTLISDDSSYSLSHDLFDIKERLCLNVQLEPELLGSIMISPPGALGRCLVIDQFGNSR